MASRILLPLLGSLIPGKYIFESHNNWDGYLRASGTPEEIIGFLTNGPEALFEWTENGDTYSTTFTTGEMKKPLTFRIGVPLVDTTPGGKKETVTAIRAAPNQLHFTTVHEDGFQATADQLFDKEGLTIIWRWNGEVASERFKRI